MKTVAKYVMVQFDNDNEADAFVNVMVPSEVQPPGAAAAFTSSVKIVAVFKKPTIFCECSKPSEKSVRGAKWGWWLCKNTGCGKPKRGNFQQPRNLVDPPNIRSEIRRIWLNIREPL
jgi:hypothetical protein